MAAETNGATSDDRLRTQRRNRRIAMAAGEIDDFLTHEHTCRVATVSGDGPHVTALWFVWDGTAVWLYSVIRSRRWTDLREDPRAAIIVDAGQEYLELRGVEITGSAAVVGEIPRVGVPCHQLDEPERLFARKYFGCDDMPHDERHGWLRVTPQKIMSWDFRKIAR